LEENSILLKVDSINTYIGKSHILHGLSFDIEKGKITTLLGRNGVGKSMTLKSIIGFTSPQQGSIRFNGEEIAGLRTYKICRMGSAMFLRSAVSFPD